VRLPFVTITTQTLAWGAMQLNQIRYFLALYEERNFTRAARRCGVSQPSLTNAVKRLERAFGNPLFERTSRNTEPTELGQVVRPYLEQISKYAEEAKRKAENSLHR
jgi:DNA-binding transcriptional LysR family regulator